MKVKKTYKLINNNKNFGLFFDFKFTNLKLKEKVKMKK